MQLRITSRYSGWNHEENKDVGTMGKESRWGKLNWIKQRILRLCGCSGWWQEEGRSFPNVSLSWLWKQGNLQTWQMQGEWTLGRKDLNILSSDLNIFILAFNETSQKLPDGLWLKRQNLTSILSCWELVYMNLSKLSNRGHAGWTYRESRALGTNGECEASRKNTNLLCNE